jgi:hypothetical protein
MPVEQAPISKSKKRDAESDTDFRAVSDESETDGEDKMDDVQSEPPALGIGEVASRSVPEAGPAAQPSAAKPAGSSAPLAPHQPKPSPRRPSSVKKAKPSGIVPKKLIKKTLP